MKTVRKKAGTKNRKKLIGASPATLVHIGEQRMDRCALRISDYNEEKFDCHSSLSGAVSEIPITAPLGKRWIVVTGLHVSEQIEALCTRFEIPPLVIEDNLIIQSSYWS